MSSDWKHLLDHKDDLSKGRALSLVSGCFSNGSSWESLQEDDMDLQVIPQGFVNRIYVCSNRKSGEKVLIRLYGGKLVGDIYSVLKNHGISVEVLVSYLMGEKGIGPKVMAVFDEGRIEEYFDQSQTLEEYHFRDQSIMSCLARQLSRLHSIDIPINRRPKDILSIIRDTWETKWPSFKDYVSRDQRHCESFDYDFLSLINWFEVTRKKIPSRIVLSHNDMNRTNFLVVPQKESQKERLERVMIVDFEICAYNYRGCDIGSHFKNRTIDVRKLFDGSNPYDTGIPYPTEEERRFFVRQYLREAETWITDWNQETDTEDHLLLEAEFYGLLYHFFFACTFMILMYDNQKKEEKTVSQDNRSQDDRSQDNSRHPGIMLSFFVDDIILRKNNVEDLLNRIRKTSR